jgi:hypothetical protein
MPRKCTICHHEKRDEIDAALVERQPFRHIAAHYSVSTSALVRHSDDHLPASLVKAKEAAAIAHADTILSQVQDLRDRALIILNKAEEAEDYRGALSAIREARGCLELLGKLAGELQDGPSINILVSPAWINLQSVIINALDAHPVAKIAVADALNAVEVGHA